MRRMHDAVNPRRRLKRFAGLATAASMLWAGSLAAQEPASAPLYELPLDGPAIGIYGGIHRGTIDASFAVDSRGLTRETDCGAYENGSTDGFLFGLHGELPMTQILGVQAAAELAVRDASMRYPCIDPAGTRMPDGSVVPATTEFISDAGYRLLSLEVAATFRPLSFPFLASIGPRLALLTHAEYSAREVIVTPTEASFLDGGQERRIGAGDFGTGDISIAIHGSVWYELALGGRWWLVPRIAGSLSLTDEITAGAIRSAGLDATLGITYRLPPRTTEATPIDPGAAPAAR